ncbi:MAG TPA: hypothetical protein VKB51_13985 [bacterium]|nr:hypothetical protein [bacterium]
MARKGNREGGRKRRRRQEGKEFMDAAMDGYIRDLALHRWRDYEDLADVYGSEAPRALEETGAVLGEEPYRALWQAAWQRHVWPGGEDPQMHLFGRMELAVREALLAEQEARAERGDRTIEDTPGYNEFVGRALGNLFHEASGEIEELD